MILLILKILMQCYSKSIKKSYKDIGIYNIGYVTKKKIGDCMNINSVNPLYLNITHSNGYIEEKGVNKYLIFDSKDERKNYLKL